MKPHMIGLLSAALMASCGYTVPYQTSGPALSANGVQVRLLGDRCYVNRSGEQFPTSVDDDRLGIDVRLQIDNTSALPAQVSLGRFELADGAAPGSGVISPYEAEMVTLSPGETRTVGLEFETQTTLDCRHSFALDVNDAVAIAGKRVDLAAIRFQPAR